jgi:predicted DNA-binding transcriptional regulator AlpA
MNQEQPALLDTHSAAFFIGAKSQVLKLSRMKGEIYKGVKAPPFVKLGHTVRYKRADLEAWLDQQTTQQKTVKAGK